MSQWHVGVHPNGTVVSQCHTGVSMAHGGPMSSRGPEVMLVSQWHMAAHPSVVLVSQWHMGVPLKCDGMGVSRWHVGSQWHGGAHPNVLVVSQWHVGGLVAHGGPDVV